MFSSVNVVIAIFVLFSGSRARKVFASSMPLSCQPSSRAIQTRRRSWLARKVLTLWRPSGATMSDSVSGGGDSHRYLGNYSRLRLFLPKKLRWRQCRHWHNADITRTFFSPSRTPGPHCTVDSSPGTYCNYEVNVRQEWMSLHHTTCLDLVTKTRSLSTCPSAKARRETRNRVRTVMPGDPLLRVSIASVSWWWQLDRCQMCLKASKRDWDIHSRDSMLPFTIRQQGSCDCFGVFECWLFKLGKVICFKYGAGCLRKIGRAFYKIVISEWLSGTKHCVNIM